MSDATDQATSGGEYVVVARRYRPQTFSELIGQQHVAGALQQAIRTGRIGHAYLFTGARGVGKTSAARILAKALNCESGPTPEPCGKCDACDRIATGDDVDVLEIDGASNRGIDEIRQLRQNAGVRPSRSRMKVYIIDEVHMLTKEAFNALLKTLEEPPEHVKFIFATTEPQKIPITILSRCQRFDFAGVDAGAIGERLRQIAVAEGVGIDDEALQVLAVRAAGSMRDSQSLLEQLLAVADGQITSEHVNRLLGIAPAARVAELAERLAERNAAASLSLLDAAVRSGADPGQVLDQLMGYYRDVMAAAVGCPPEQMLTALPAQYDAAKELGQRLGVNTLLAAMQVLDQTAARMRVSVHERTLADMAIVRLATLEDLEDLAQAVADLRANPGAAIAAPKKNTEPNALASGEPAERAPRPALAPPVVPANPPHIAVATRPPSTPRPAAPPAMAPPPPAATTVAVATPPPASEPDSDPNSIMAEFAAMQQTVKASKPTAGVPRRVSRRQQQTEIAQQPFVAKAMELFGVEADKLRYTPPRSE
ncbi:DNA polymerase III subunit tau [Botrimarina colliarenosi]|uniref:DNA polymerase III subunit gamma/tau n=1 Tax=Botrimarina colliarenosi TaxID=2528001 RepID=A0A5C6AKX0_9BACT|nr:DNA polymerase III subunit gamma/tau [Botrimarina colliarenosi]TWU00051.1 DNA polymerase III subunit tau [Botrimarina colliarenosi]